MHLTEKHFAVAAVLADQQPCRPREISAAAGIAATVVSRVLGELERAGVVAFANETPHGDRRARYYVLAEIA